MAPYLIPPPLLTSLPLPHTLNSNHPNPNPYLLLTPFFTLNPSSITPPLTHPQPHLPHTPTLTHPLPLTSFTYPHPHTPPLDPDPSPSSLNSLSGCQKRNYLRKDNFCVVFTSTAVIACGVVASETDDASGREES